MAALLSVHDSPHERKCKFIKPADDPHVVYRAPAEIVPELDVSATVSPVLHGHKFSVAVNNRLRAAALYTDCGAAQFTLPSGSITRQPIGRGLPGAQFAQILCSLFKEVQEILKLGGGSSKA